MINFSSIREYRRERNLSQRKLERMCNLSSGLLTRLEHGDHPMVAYKTIYLLAKALEVGIEDMSHPYLPLADRSYTEEILLYRVRSLSPDKKRRLSLALDTLESDNERSEHVNTSY